MKLLLAVFEQTLTGILYVKNEEVLKVLYFNRGKLIWAISNSEEDKLENILSVRDLVDPNILLKVKREAHVTESIGKLLVEKGLITLEELIDSSKIQLKRIIFSILKWKTGGFQFVKDAPPERLLSLDLSITNFIVDFILDEMDISDIWKEIGSLQVELIKNPDEEKINKYRLSEKQLALLNGFSGKDKLEAVLSRYSGGHRESLLKIIYFFLMSELLIKKEFELADSSVFEEDASFEYFHMEEQEPEPEEIEPVKSIPKYSQSEEEPGSFMFSARENDQPVSYSSSADSLAPTEEEIFNEAKTKKIKTATWILVIFVLILGGIILLILPLMLNENPIDRLKSAPDNGPAAQDIITIDERKPVVEKTEDQKMVEPGGETSGTPSETPSEISSVTPQEIIATPGEKPAAVDAEKKIPEEKPKLPAGKSAMAYFQEGNMITAGDIWKQELLNAGIKYSILLELDCQKESVIGAFDRVEAKDGFFILNKPSQARTCFLVMWGKYQTREAAAAGLKLVPQYFWHQPNPPEVIDVTKYL